ncbi:hypothetical protein NA78x_001772 [Anatilimnocola sp. NA78]|uniref:hypothetical protein n=1 Tax=Anatilimnocola sp. NA78 TaxID=3415683 RepID=UPI003CE4FB25
MIYTAIFETRGRPTVYQVGIKHDGHSHIIRFRPNQANQVRVALATRGIRGELPWDIAFEACRRVFKLIGKAEMDELELLAEQLQKKGFFVHLERQPEGWNCMLSTSGVYRPPTGRGNTAFEAIQAAVEDLADIRKAAKSK